MTILQNFNSGEFGVMMNMYLKRRLKEKKVPRGRHLWFKMLDKFRLDDSQRGLTHDYEDLMAWSLPPNATVDQLQLGMDRWWHLEDNYSCGGPDIRLKLVRFEKQFEIKGKVWECRIPFLSEEWKDYRMRQYKDQEFKDPKECLDHMIRCVTGKIEFFRRFDVRDCKRDGKMFPGTGDKNGDKVLLGLSAPTGGGR